MPIAERQRGNSDTSTGSLGDISVRHPVLALVKGSKKD
jgi:hypothetical protein